MVACCTDRLTQAGDFREKSRGIWRRESDHFVNSPYNSDMIFEQASHRHRHTPLHFNRPAPLHRRHAPLHRTAAPLHRRRALLRSRSEVILHHPERPKSTAKTRHIVNSS